MEKRGQDVLLGSTLGLMVGALPGLLAAGAYVTWRLGGDLGQIGLSTFTDLLPETAALAAWPFQTGALLGLGVAVSSAFAGVALFWREELSSHGTARWAERRELRRAGLLARRVREARGPIWGKLGTPRSWAPYLSSSAIVHSLVAAPTGAGKGVGIVIPTLLTYVGSTVVLDVKGENYAKTARRRQRMGDRVFKFAPYAKDRRSHRYNPFDEVAAAPERRRFAEALRLANSLIEAKGKGTESWVDGAREIFAATAVVAHERGTPTIAAVYDLLTQAGPTTELLERLGAETGSGEARSIFNRFASQPEKVLGSYVSVMFDGGLRLWADPDVRDATSASDFRIETFRADPASVYLCVGQKDLGVLSPLIRLMFQQMFMLLQETDKTEKDRFDVLFLLDEFASLGKMEEMGRAITTVRSSGAHLMLIVQSLANLRETYGADGAANFMGNCELQLFMAPTDMDTPRYVSEAIGDQTRRARVKSWRQRGWDAATIQERNEGARLIRPEQIRLLGPEAAVALIRDQNPVRLGKVKYYEDRALKRIFAEQDRVSLAEPPEMAATPLPGEAAARVAKGSDGGAGKEPPPSPAALVTTPVPPAPPTPAVVVPDEPSVPTDDAGGDEAATERKLDRLVSDQRGIASEMADLISQARRNLRSNYAPDA
ncbi:type IV secretory system conjugative DNA transfer family protein [Amaricoccus sp. W119]|uniref:type IV secretory system conjugative DNA transfer family protein n=1 Tax=Amaricoccus sp. W119 TaxID=3391833 RepID=UPI0039A45696